MRKQYEAFIDAYVGDIKRNQTAAAIKAGYSEKTARQQASRLMKIPEIEAAIKERLEEIRKQNTAEATEVIMFLTLVMRGEETLDNVPLRTILGSEEMKKTEPNARDRLKAAELLGRHYGILEKQSGGGDDEGGVIILPEVQTEAAEVTERADSS